MNLTRRQAIAGTCAALVAGSLGGTNTESVPPECRDCRLLDTEFREQLRQSMAAIRLSATRAEEAFTEAARLSGTDFRRTILEVREYVTRVEAALDGVA